ncbi:SAF domain-containing protein [Anaerosporobacter faecicola]|uniref:SAF domain-containing protein n=1 Tax=Anaerosporobacter faecicola TaxID=2718714 RepID=UPI00143B8C26|nr:SAF domain-containing protein [Anaerosporobacter faecicola]
MAKGKIAVVVIGMILLVGGIGTGIVLSIQSKNKQEASSSIVNNQYGIVITADLKQGEIITIDQIKQVALTEELQVLNAASYEEVIGKRLRYKVAANTMLIPEMIEDGEKVSEDTRKHCYHFIEMTDALCVGDYVDIRIQFPNGADYIILSKKKVLACSQYNEQEGTQNDLWLEVSEEEILLLSSAVVDAVLQEQARIYAIQYVSQDQEKAIITYPENEIVHALIQEDPNIIQQAIKKMENRVRERVNMGLKEYGQEQDKGYTNEQDPSNDGGDDVTLDQLEINYVD